MTTHIAFLRAVNVGRRTVSMAALAEVCRELGYGDVWTHVNSGNAIFDATGRRTKIEDALSSALEARFGFEVTTFVRTHRELVAAMAVEPFRLEPHDTYFITFLRSAPSAQAKQDLEAASNEFDTIEVHGMDVHWRMRGKSTDTTVKPAVWRRAVGEHGSTSRNTNMLRGLLAKIDTRS